MNELIFSTRILYARRLIKILMIIIWTSCTVSIGFNNLILPTFLSFTSCLVWWILNEIWLTLGAGSIQIDSTSYVTLVWDTLSDIVKILMRIFRASLTFPCDRKIGWAIVWTILRNTFKSLFIWIWVYWAFLTCAITNNDHVIIPVYILLNFYRWLARILNTLDLIFRLMVIFGTCFTGSI